MSTITVTANIKSHVLKAKITGPVRYVQDLIEESLIEDSHSQIASIVALVHELNDPDIRVQNYYGRTAELVELVVGNKVYKWTKID